MSRFSDLLHEAQRVIDQVMSDQLDREHAQVKQSPAERAAEAEQDELYDEDDYEDYLARAAAETQAKRHQAEHDSYRLGRAQARAAGAELSARQLPGREDGKQWHPYTWDAVGPDGSDRSGQTIMRDRSLPLMVSGMHKAGYQELAVHRGEDRARVGGIIPAEPGIPATPWHVPNGAYQPEYLAESQQMQMRPF